MSHALLAPSSAHRWLVCPPSARLEAEQPDRAGDAAREGTLAHKLGETMIYRALKIFSKFNFDAEVASIKRNPLYKPEMWSYCEGYADYVIERFNNARSIDPTAELFIEQKFGIGFLTGEKNAEGTGDCCIIYNRCLEFIDLKYGKGVKVEAEQNPQLYIYALGALNRFDLVYGIRDVVLTIYQPRIDNIDTQQITASALYSWAETFVKPRAAEALAGEGAFNPGEKQCMFCKVAPTCKALADKNLELAKYAFAEAQMLSDSDIADILLRASMFEKWLKHIKQYALMKAVHEGHQWPKLKLVEGRSNRKYTDQKKIAELLLAEGFVEGVIYKPQELIDITYLEGIMGKKNFAALIGEFTVKPPGKPALVSEDDKRPAYNSLKDAAKAFEGIEFETTE